MVLIKNAVVPPSCYFCPMTNDGFYLCKANNPYRQLEDDCEEHRPDWCPLIEVPEPHGHLIDASVRVDVQMYDEEFEDYQIVNMSIDDLLDSSWIELENDPTIIPASEDNHDRT